MAGATGKSLVGRFGVHAAVLVFVAIWTIPTLGILVSSLRDKDQIIASGWWSVRQLQPDRSRPAAGRLAQVEKDGKFVLKATFSRDGAVRTSAPLASSPPRRHSIAPARPPISATA
jgi:alpha-glucoside transport system permease protein